MPNLKKLLQTDLLKFKRYSKKNPTLFRLVTPFLVLFVITLSLGLFQLVSLSSGLIQNSRVAGISTTSAEIASPQPTSQPTACGDGVCIDSENIESCPLDCGGDPIPTNEPLPSTANCQPSGSIIYVSASDTSKCLNIQAAIDNAGEGFTIKFDSGTYNVPFYTPEASLKINSKKKLTLSGDSSRGNQAVVLNIDSRKAGIKIDNSQDVSIEWMMINGKSVNGIVQVNDSRGTSLRQLNISDSGANPVQIYGSHNFVLVNSSVSSGDRIAVGFSNSQGMTIANNVISNNNTALSISNSSGKIFGNLLDANNDHGILIHNPQSFEIYKNTIVNTNGGGSQYPSGIMIDQINPTYTTIVKIYKNIIANGVYGVFFKDGINDIDTFEFAVNDVWNNSTADYKGFASQTGLYANISQDPLFGDGYCININSPAVYGYIPLGESMGNRGICGSITGSPSPSPIPTFRPNPSPSIIPTISPTIAPTPIASPRPTSVPTSCSTDLECLNWGTGNSCKNGSCYWMISSPSPSIVPTIAPSPISTYRPEPSPIVDICGDGICSNGENSNSCPIDCGAPPTVAPTVAPTSVPIVAPVQTKPNYFTGFTKPISDGYQRVFTFFRNRFR